MSQRASGQSYRADSGPLTRAEVPRPVGRPRRTDYTFVHAGRQVRLGPITFWIAVGTLVIMAGWSLATGTYFAFKDDVLTRVMARQKDAQFAYEDRIAELRAQVDRITSRQLLNQEQFEQKLEQIVRRQTVLESRAASLSALPDNAPTGSIRPRPAPMSDRPAGGLLKPSPIGDTDIFTAPSGRGAWLESREPASSKRRLAAARFRAGAKIAAVGMEGMLARLDASLDRVEQRQAASLDSLEERYDSKARRIRGVLTDLGMDARKQDSGGPHGAGIGGPFVPVTLKKGASAFDRQLYRIYVARAHFDRLNRTLTAVPVRQPIPGDADLSSGFGVRTDPFLGRPAMHTGLDFRASTGDAVHATAAGTVDIAAWTGGYGKMVEINHGNGFSTRYGHMSEIDVKVGQKIAIGQVIGHVGSTGRSTGPHLHYETRIDGEAVDPQKFLRAGVRLGGLL